VVDQPEAAGLEDLAEPISEPFLWERFPDLQLRDGPGDLARQVAQLLTGGARFLAGAPELGSKVLSGRGYADAGA
jgi:hypothetical protein